MLPELVEGEACAPSSFSSSYTLRFYLSVLKEKPVTPSSFSSCYLSLLSEKPVPPSSISSSASSQRASGSPNLYLFFRQELLFLHTIINTRTHKVLSYVEYRAVSGVFENIDPPPPSPPSECVLPPHQRRGEHYLTIKFKRKTNFYRETLSLHKLILKLRIFCMGGGGAWNLLCHH